MSHRGGGGGGGDERWLVSYADFITLLMVLFVVLYSMGQVDVNRYKELAESLRLAFAGGPARIVDPKINKGGSGTGDSAPAPIVIPGMPSRPPDSLDVAARISDLLKSANLSVEISVRTNVEGVLISLSEKLLFIPRKAELRSEALTVLDSVVKIIAPLPNEIRIVGHTDTLPPSDSRFRTNWELSVARAVTIVGYFIDAGVEPIRLTAAGQGEFRPIYPNDSEDHRSLNGRADIIIVYPIEKTVVDWGSFDIPDDDPSGVLGEPIEGQP